MNASQRITRRLLFQIVAVACALLLVPSTVGAEPSSPAQNSENLRERAQRIAAELEDLAGRTSALDEDYNSTYLEVEKLKVGISGTQAEVDKAKAAFTKNESQAKAIAVEAYVGNTTSDKDVELLGSDSLDEASRRRTYLTAAHGDRSAVMDDIDVARQDLESKEARLAAQKADVDTKLAELEDAKDELASNIDRQEELYASVQGELATAVEAERAARAEAQAAETRRQSQTNAREATSRQASASAVRAAAPAPASARGGSSAAPAPAASAPVVPQAPAPVAGPISAAGRAVQTAMAQRGKPYVWAASGPNSFDCSGLIQYAYSSAGVSLPHSSRALRSITRSLSESQLQPGDLVFGGSPVHHVGMYIGGGQMVHSPSSGDVVKVSGIYRVTSSVSFGRL